MGGILVMGNTMQPEKEERKRNVKEKKCERKKKKTVIRHEGNKLNFLFVNVRQDPRQGKKGDTILQRCKYFPGVMTQMLVTVVFEPVF